VRIALLDTGVNLDNPWMSSKRSRIRCWPSEEECKDTDGHGTHVAYLMLRLTEHTQLRIAKINGGQTLDAKNMKETAGKIAEVSVSVDNNL
jgi:hypothetical protein